MRVTRNGYKFAHDDAFAFHALETDKGGLWLIVAGKFKSLLAV